MAAQSKRSPWYRHFIYRKESWKTTWKLRLLVPIVVAALVWFGRPIWTTPFAQSLVCSAQTPNSDALLLENFDPEYLVFERAQRLKTRGVSSRVFIPIEANDAGESNEVERGTIELYGQISGLRDYATIPVRHVEPISLNAALQIRDVLVREHVRSVIVLSPDFRSRRSALVYRTVLMPAGIQVHCDPVFGDVTGANWTHTWHGMQDVLEQFTKLQYYRFWVLGLRKS